MIDLRICGFDWKIDGTFKGSFENAVVPYVYF
jgi:hypothetical protein